MNKYRIKLFTIALLAVALGTLSCSDDAEKDVRAEAISVTPDNTIMIVNTTMTLVADVYPIETTDKRVIWTSENPSVATVDANGLVNALSEGVATITVVAASNEKRIKTCTVTVVSSLEISLDVNSLGILLGTSRTLKATILPDNIVQDVIWTSDNDEVATVDGGVVTAIAAGTANITATSVVSDDRKATCVVTVIDVSSLPAGKQITGIWAFDDKDDIGKATVGYSLIKQGDGFTFVDGPSAGNGAVRIASGSYFRVLHGIATSGNDRVNNYTVMFDFKVPDTDHFRCFYQTTLDNSDDGEYFLRPGGNIGVGGTGYSDHTVTVGEWHRLVLSASMDNSYLTYLDGVLIHEGNVGSAFKDSRFSWFPESVLFFADDDGEDAEIDVAEMMVWDVAIDASQVSALGAIR